MESNQQASPRQETVDAHPFVTVIYNGLSREIGFQPTELVDVIRMPERVNDFETPTVCIY